MASAVLLKMGSGRRSRPTEEAKKSSGVGAGQIAARWSNSLAVQVEHRNILGLTESHASPSRSRQKKLPVPQ